MESLCLFMFIALIMLIIFFVIAIMKIADISKEIRRAVDELIVHTKHTNNPQKPVRKDKHDSNVKCPVCGHFLFKYDSFCGKCGQKIDWGDDWSDEE